VSDGPRTEPIDTARQFADEIERHVGSPTDPGLRIATIKALEFLKQFAPDSVFHAEANEKVVYSSGAAVSGRAKQALRALNGWIQYQRTGLADTLPYDAQFRIDASTDLMEQVEDLINDQQVHPAVPAMLAGAALEEFLRSMLEMTDETVAGHGNLEKCKAALQRADVISKSDAKDITSMAGVRNDADHTDADHGHFDAITPERAKVLAQQVNLFMAKNSST